MSVTKLGCLVSAIHQINNNVLFSRLSMPQTATSILRHKSETSASRKDKNDDDDGLDKPIKFSTSGAATWDAVQSRTGAPSNDNRPWFQTWVVIASTSAILIYFCVLRRENDIDQKLMMNLTDHFDGERKRNLEKSMQIPHETATVLRNK